MTRRIIAWATCASVVIGSIAWSTAVSAQTTESADPQAGAPKEIDRIVVTTRKREESLQEVPLSITAISSAEIEAAGIDGIDDIALMTPGFTFAPLFGGGAATPVIRGQSTTIGEPNVGFFVDGVYQSSRTIMDSMLGSNIERVEVARGPQSALYGRNTFAGAVNFVTRRPSNDFEGSVSVTGGKDSQFGAKGNISGPIIADTLLYELAGAYSRRDGYFKNELTGGDLDDRKSLVFSGALLALPTEDLEIRLRLGYEDTSDGDDPLRFLANNSAPANPTPAPLPTALQLFSGTMPSFERGFAVTPGFNDRSNFSSSLSASWDLGNLNLTSITGYNDLSFDSAVDNDYSSRSLRFQTQEIDQDEFSQELRLTSAGDEPLRWMIGVYYYELEIETDTVDTFVDGALALASTLSTTPLAGLLPPGIINTTKEETESFAIFGQLAYDFTEELTVSLEGRWTTEEKKAFAVDTNPLSGASATFQDEVDFKNFVPRLTLDYQAHENLLLYATVAKAVKTGGFNVVTAAGAILPGERVYDEEKSWNYEVGAKTTLADGRVQLNVAGFYTDWSDQIVRALGATFAVLNANAGDTSAQGIEIELRAQPFEGLSVTAGFAYTDSEYDRYNFGALSGLGLNPVLDGTRLQYVSEYTGNLSVQYAHPVMDDWDWVSRLDFAYQSDQSTVQTADAQVGDATLVNLRTGFENERWSLTFWVENLFEEDSAVTGVFIPNQATRFDTAAGFPGLGFQAFGGLVTSRDPRIWGATLTYRF